MNRGTNLLRVRGFLLKALGSILEGKRFRFSTQANKDSTLALLKLICSKWNIATLAPTDSILFYLGY